MTDIAETTPIEEAQPIRQPLSPHLNSGVLGRAALAALVLGSVLMLANQPGAVFGPENIELPPFLLGYLTPFVVVTISQLLGARRAAADSGRGEASGAGAASFAATALSHGIPRRAILVGSLVAGVNAAIMIGVALVEQGNLNALPLALIGQAFALPVLFGVLSQAIAYRRASAALMARH